MLLLNCTLYSISKCFLLCYACCVCNLLNIRLTQLMYVGLVSVLLFIIAALVHRIFYFILCFISLLRNSLCLHYVYLLFLLQASRGQSADLILVDEVGFVNSKVLLSVLPNIAFRGRKQVHITSHVSETPWLNKVSDILGDNGEPAYHVVSQSFKCRYHARDLGLTCFCLSVYCPQHITVQAPLKELMNMVIPKGFECEVTGSTSTSSADTKNDTTTPFEPRIINKFLSNNTVTLAYLTQGSVIRAYMCLDPTFGGGSMSCAGVCCALELANGKLVVSKTLIFSLLNLTLVAHEIYSHNSKTDCPCPLHIYFPLAQVVDPKAYKCMSLYVQLPVLPKLSQYREQNMRAGSGLESRCHMYISVHTAQMSKRLLPELLCYDETPCPA